mmetsp:Transcript_3463/g.13945  ORF Transcript_3463/g.13945 Transcript_3463/m.13945 type:complete len:220 (-) Transcript_3463:1140-1799(-)
MARIFVVSSGCSLRTNCAWRYRTAPSKPVTCSMRLPSCSNRGVKKICPRITSAAYMPSSLSATSRSSSNGNRSFCTADSRNSDTSVIGMVVNKRSPISAIGPSRPLAPADLPTLNFFSDPPTRATPTTSPFSSAFTSKSNSMMSIPHSCVICVFSEPSSFMDHTFATPSLSERKNTVHGNAGVVAGAHAPRLVHASSVNSFASSSPSHQRHKRLCSPPS